MCEYVLTCSDASLYGLGMKNRVAITIKLPPDLIEKADAFIEALPFRPTRTAFIEEAIRQALERASEGKKKR